MTEAYIYALCDPDTNDVRYVGMTLTPQARLRQHLADRRLTLKVKWIQQLRAAGKRPLMTILGTCAVADRFVVEQWHINAQRGAGAKLLNGLHNSEAERRKQEAQVEAALYVRIETAERGIRFYEGDIVRLSKAIEREELAHELKCLAMEQELHELRQQLRTVKAEIAVWENGVAS